MKFRFKDIEGITNVQWYNDFVLSGIAFEGNSAPIDIDKLFFEFNLQKNIHDVKLRHIADYNGEDSKRFIEILKSKKVTILLNTLLHSDHIYIHWATQNLLYYFLINIVDSVLEIPFIHDEVKNVLYNHALKYIDLLMSLLSRYDYPNLKGNEISIFCEQFICWIDSLEPQNQQDDFALELLRQGIKVSRKTDSLLFLENNTDKLLLKTLPRYMR